MERETGAGDLVLICFVSVNTGFSVIFSITFQRILQEKLVRRHWDAL
jgi:hypothetical protein